MASDALHTVLLQTARRDFPVFYANATAIEAKLMDMLVLLTALFVRLNEPKRADELNTHSRGEELAATQHMFGDLREFVRKGRTFATLPTIEREKIQRVIFDRFG